MHIYIYILNLASKLKRSTSKAGERFVDEITAIFCTFKKLPMVMKEERHGRQYICKNFSQQALQLHVSPMYTYYDLHSSDHVAFSHFHHWLNQTFDH